ncbi:hypothetical protein C8R43DRAFT_940463 [Mycena crocata]|nr:hypothetical protein C8R43DRAFT_940463 [Mycena crocata]
MTENPNTNTISTEDPPGTREGFGDVVQPSRQCLPAASSECEISRSQGIQGPIPGYRTLGPSCDSSVALAITEYGEERHYTTTPNTNTLVSCPPWMSASSTEDDGTGGPLHTRISSVRNMIPEIMPRPSRQRDGKLQTAR